MIEKATIEDYTNFVNEILSNLSLIKKDIKYFSGIGPLNIIVAVDTEEIVSFSLSQSHLLLDLEDKEKVKKEICSIAQIFVMFNKDNRLSIEEKYQLQNVILLPPYIDELIDLLWHWRERIKMLSNGEEAIKLIDKFVVEIKNDKEWKELKGESLTDNNKIEEFVKFVARRFTDFYLAVTGSIDITSETIRKLLGVNEDDKVKENDKDSPIKFVNEKILESFGFEDNKDLEEFKKALISFINYHNAKYPGAILDIEKAFASMPGRGNTDLANIRDAVSVYLVSIFNKMKTNKEMVLFSDAPSMKHIKEKISANTVQLLSKFELRDSDYFVTFLAVLPNAGNSNPENEKRNILKNIEDLQEIFEQYAATLNFYANIINNQRDNISNEEETILNPWAHHKSKEQINKSGYRSLQQLLEDIEKKVDSLKVKLKKEEGLSTSGIQNQKKALDIRNKLSHLIDEFNTSKENKGSLSNRISTVNEKIRNIVEGVDMNLISKTYYDYNNLKYIYHRDKFLSFHKNRINNMRSQKNIVNTDNKLILKDILNKLMSDEHKDSINQALVNIMKNKKESVEKRSRSVISALIETLLHYTPSMLKSGSVPTIKVNFRRLITKYPWKIGFKNGAIVNAIKEFSDTLNKKGRGKITQKRIENAFKNLIKLSLGHPLEEKGEVKDKNETFAFERYLLGAAISFSLTWYHKAYFLIFNFLETKENVYNDDELKDMIALEFLTLGKLLRNEEEFFKNRFILLKDAYWNAKNNEIEKMDPRILNVVAIANYERIIRKGSDRNIEKKEDPVYLLGKAIKNVENNNTSEEDKKKLKLFLLNNLIYIKMETGMYIKSTTKQGKDFLITKYDETFDEDIKNFKELLAEVSTGKKEKVGDFNDLYKKTNKSELYKILYEIPETIAEIECYRLKNANIQDPEDKKMINKSINKWLNLYNGLVKSLNNRKEKYFENICSKIKGIIKEKHLSKV